MKNLDRGGLPTGTVIRFLRRPFLLILFTFLFVAFCLSVYANDPPHNEASGISCPDCHGQTLLNGQSPFWTENTTDSAYNSICLGVCHTDPVGPGSEFSGPVAPMVKSHNPGGTVIKCTVCHHNHDQVQIYSGKNEKNAFFIATGTLDSEVPVSTLLDYNSGDDTTVITYKTLAATDGTSKWADLSFLAQKTGDGRGAMLVPNHTSRKRWPVYIIKSIDTTPGVQTITVKGQVTAASNLGVFFGQVVRRSVNYEPLAGMPKSVKFYDNTGANSFTSTTAPYGICQVCHTDTNHWRNDGSMTEDHFFEQNCTKSCHKHTNSLVHCKEGSPLCTDCHYSSGPAPEEYCSDALVTCSDCHHTGSHGIHLDLYDPRGPAVICSACHDMANYPYFQSGTDVNGDNLYDLSETDVCDTCHSPNGTYDGIDDATVGAKPNWMTGVYTGDSLNAGMEKWCATCHDEEPSVIQGVAAPNIVGDEDQNTNYGIGWGYYKTGHGLAEGVYPASEAPAANQECSGCHDFAAIHIDGEHRTYLAADDNYQEGYRLKDVGGGPPMDIPRSGSAADDFGLCFACHQSGPFTFQHNGDTNFRNDSTGVNSHWYHLMSTRPWNDWDSDWDGATGDSRISCPSCHNVHGSVSPRMVRHGELISTPGTIDKVPALEFQYIPADTYPTLAESTGGKTRSIGAGAGTIAKNGVCNMCHNDSYTYSRTPTDLYFHEIKAVYGQVGSTVLTVVFSEGVYSDTGSTGDLVIEDFTLTDTDNNRTITNVTHTAGDNVASLTISSSLDSFDDIGTDTLAAASMTSIYDSSDNPMDTTLVTISGDTDPPAISNLDPANGAVGIAQNSDLTFTLSDSGAGIDWTTFSIQLSGDQGYAKTYTDTDILVVSKTGVPAVYVVTVLPAVLFNEGEVITVTINVDDLGGNSLVPPGWSFTTASVPNLWQTPDSVYASLNIGSPGNLIDDNTSTGNGFGRGGPSHYATFKLAAGGNQYKVTDVRLYGGPAYTTNWEVFVSDNGSAFTSIGSWSVGGADQWYEYTFPASQTARYIKIEDWHPGPESPDMVFEFQFKSIPDTEPKIIECQADAVNLFLAGESEEVLLTCLVLDADDNLDSVVVGLSSLGGSGAQAMYDNGTNGDVTAGDGIYSFRATVPPAAGSGFKTLTVTATDDDAQTSNSDISLNVLAVVGGEIVPESAGPLDVPWTDDLIITDSLTIGSDITLSVTGDLTVGAILTIENGGSLALVGSNKTDINGGTAENPYGSGRTITATDIIINAGGSFSADGQGFCYGNGPGAGIRGAGNYGSGGAYGGSGGDDADGDAGGSAYGTASSPTALGSGGGPGDRTTGGCGGGAIKIVAGNTITVDGILSANGTSSTGDRSYNGGGGSGGSIWIESGTLTGTGTISTQGGPSAEIYGVGYAGGGSGGRIDVSGTAYNFTGTVSVTGGTGGTGGSMGTVVFPTFDNLTVVNGQTLTINGTLIVTNTLTVESGGTIIVGSEKHDINGGTAENPFGSGGTITSTDIIIAAGGSINADGQGFCYGHGPGAGILGAGNRGTGGAYGGSGGDNVDGDAGGSAYGAASSPTALGSGGGPGLRATGGCGGGAIKIVAGNTITVDGTLSANGTSPTGDRSYNGGGGSGGSIWIESGTLTGTGTISTQGGPSAELHGVGNAGGGSGGRIDVSGTTYNFTGNLSVAGGSGSQGGSMGSVVFPTFDNLTIVDGQTLTIGTTLTVTNTLTVESGGTINLGSEKHDINGGTAENPYGSGGTITATDIIIAAGGSINADGQGFCYGHGPGAGIQGAGDRGSGGAYGGSGGNDVDGDAGGSAYGAASSPTALGSGGGPGVLASGGCGGGAIKINASGTITVDGTLSANGTSSAGVRSYNGGGGSGGSIWIESGTLTGIGKITTQGADANATYAGGGGGGRIDVSGTTNNFTGTTSVNGGTGFATGAAGTIQP